MRIKRIIDGFVDLIDDENGAVVFSMYEDEIQRDLDALDLPYTDENLKRILIDRHDISLEDSH